MTLDFLSTYLHLTQANTIQARSTHIACGITGRRKIYAGSWFFSTTFVSLIRTLQSSEIWSTIVIVCFSTPMSSIFSSGGRVI
jgi:hypothetical protein